ncbi:fatty acid desaturase CarF family protein [Bradyrhizobium diazoefficiens]
MREIIITRLCCAADAVVILCCAIYLVECYHAAGLRWPWLIVALLIGYFLADFFSGLVHWAVDTWLDEGVLGRGIAMTREHHTHPSHVLLYEFLDQASLGAAPSAVVVGIAAAITALFPVSALTYALMIVWFVIATCMLFGMSFHNLAHWRVRPPLLRMAQRLHLVCSPEHHLRHHRDHTVRYCVINGMGQLSVRQSPALEQAGTARDGNDRAHAAGRRCGVATQAQRYRNLRRDAAAGWIAQACRVPMLRKAPRLCIQSREPRRSTI